MKFLMHMQDEGKSPYVPDGCETRVAMYECGQTHFERQIIKISLHTLPP